MLRLLSYLAIAICYGSIANADSKYIPVDNSGSMATEARRASVRIVLQDELKTLVRANLVQRVDEHSGIEQDRFSTKKQLDAGRYRGMFSIRPPAPANKLLADKLVDRRELADDIRTFFSIWLQKSHPDAVDLKALGQLMEFDKFTLRFSN